MILIITLQIKYKFISCSMTLFCTNNMSMDIKHINIRRNILHNESIQFDISNKASQTIKYNPEFENSRKKVRIPGTVLA